LLSIFLFGCEDKQIEPYEDNTGSYSIYGAIELLTTVYGDGTTKCNIPLFSQMFIAEIYQEIEFSSDMPILAPIGKECTRFGLLSPTKLVMLKTALAF
jgi:hypothetical protein